jgi:hypothetical protein
MPEACIFIPAFSEITEFGLPSEACGVSFRALEIARLAQW